MVCGEKLIGHFATFPEKLVEPCIKAGTSEAGCCPTCGEPWIRVLKPDKEYAKNLGTWTPDTDADKNLRAMIGFAAHGKKKALTAKYNTLGWKQNCECESKESIKCVVFDPFMGSGTTAVVAQKLGRDWLGIELNQNYIDMANQRLSQRVLI